MENPFIIIGKENNLILYFSEIISVKFEELGIQQESILTINLENCPSLVVEGIDALTFYQAISKEKKKWVARVIAGDPEIAESIFNGTPND